MATTEAPRPATTHAPPKTTTAATTTAATTARPTTTEQAAAAPCEGAVERVGSSARAVAAVVRERAVAYREPGREPFARFGAKNVNRVPMVFAVRARSLGADCQAEWYHVQLPLKPNGVTGWVRAAELQLATVTTRIVVDLSDRRVTLYDGGRDVLSVRAAIGSSATPTPTGRYYVNQRLVAANPDGPYGPAALGISAFSEVLTGWTQGGPIAIHGTNRPDLLGQAVSNGCIRVRNDHLRRLFDRTLAGTPVTVRA